MAGEKVITLTSENFDSEALKPQEPVLVDFWATWCGPCKMIAPIIDELSEELSGKVKVGKVNVDENRQVAEKYGVMSIPTLIVFKGGQEVERIVGYQTKQQLIAKLEKHM